MSVLHVYTDHNRLTEIHRADLAEALTKAVLDAEVGADTPVARRGIMVLFHDIDYGMWTVGGKLDSTYVSKGGRALVVMNVMEGVWTQPRRAQVITLVSKAMAEALNLGDDPRALGSIWVIFNQIDEGSWGAMGAPISILSLLEPGGFTPDRAADARALLQDRT